MASRNPTNASHIEPLADKESKGRHAQRLPDSKSHDTSAVAAKFAGLSLASSSANGEHASSAKGPDNKLKPKPMLNPMAKNFSQGSHVKIVDGEVRTLTKPSTKSETKPNIKPMRNPFTQKAATELFKPIGLDNTGGKFANSATTEADVGETDLNIRAIPNNHIHRKPRFKQVLRKPAPESRGANTPSEAGSKLRSLLDYASEGPEHVSDGEGKNEGESLNIEGLLPRLLPHQERGVRFMARRERGRKYVRGGLLADDMGLGKTIQSIALILYHPPEKADAPRTTLVVTPLAVMDQWKDEIRQMAPKLRVGTHQGSLRTKSGQEFDDLDVLVTTYDVVSREHDSQGPLFRREWHRVIADEAHSFRGATTKACAAMAALNSDGRRWALTGTPLHNKLLDLYPLFKFIRAPQSTDVAQFEEAYTKDKDLVLLKKQLRVIMLRRTQKVLRSFLPALNLHPTKTQLTPAEFEVYRSWIPHRNESASGGAQVTTLTRMRQACDGLLNEHGRVELGWSDEKFDNKIDVKVDQEASKKSSADALKTNVVDETDDLANLLDRLSIKPKTEEKPTFMGHRNSKVAEVRQILVKDRRRRTVVFSSFVTMLVALQPMLDFEGIKFLQYDGSLTADKRRDMLAKFRDEKSEYVVLLCSLQTASVGLNLTSASQVIMVDPWWNPQIVDQAIKRVHRLGQVRDVDCYQLFARDALDERMMHIQEVKRQLAVNLIDGSAELSDADRGFLLYGNEDEDNVNAKDSDESRSPLGKTAGSDTQDTSAKALSKPPSSADAKEHARVDLPWSQQRRLPSIPKHKKFTD